MAMANQTMPSYVKFGKFEDKTNVWFYFLRESNGQSAKCLQCKVTKILKTAGGSTKGLHTHLKSAHGISLGSSTTTSAAAEGKEPEPKKQKTLRAYFLVDENSLPATLARMTARDGLPIRIFCSSPDMRELLIAKGFANIPTSPETIRDMILDYSNQIRRLVTKEITELKTQGKKFTLTFDEWTSSRNKRYVNIIVHSENKFWNIGLVRVYGTMPAEKCIELLEEKLLTHELSLKDDIVCICTDGASVMKKVGRSIKTQHQLCMAHGIQLAVVDVLYSAKNRQDLEPAALDQEDEGSRDVVEMQADCRDTQESDSEDSDDEYDAIGITEGEGSRTRKTCDVRAEFSPVIKKVRKVVYLFRSSPTKNDDILQKYVKEQFGKDLSLILDCKTRWNSLFLMLQRFLELKSCIKKALVDVKSSVITFSENEFTIVQELVDILEPLKIAVETLCCRDSTLITADTVLKFTLNKLEAKNTAMAKQLISGLRHRISERRNDMSNVLQYLHNPCSPSTSTSGSESDLFAVPTSNTLRNIMKRLLNQPSFLPSRSRDNEPYERDTDSSACPLSNEDEDQHGAQNQTESISLKEELYLAIKKDTSVNYLQNNYQLSSSHDKLDSLLKKEMSLFEGGGGRGRHLQHIYESLLTVPPTSVESERAFSAAGAICTKLRTRLGDKTLDALCFLRAYFQVQHK